MRACVECRFFRLDGFPPEGPFGLCRCRAPAPHYHQYERPEGERIIKAIWPVVSQTEEECGDFKVIPGE